MSWSKGEVAEEYVARKLKEKGWQLHARNYRRRGYELDIIASRDQRLLCIEVKARETAVLQHPARMLNERKLKKLHEGMLIWLGDRAPGEVRNTEFWLCSVLLPTSRNRVEWVRLEI